MISTQSRFHLGYHFENMYSLCMNYEYMMTCMKWDVIMYEKCIIQMYLGVSLLIECNILKEYVLPGKQYVILEVCTKQRSQHVFNFQFVLCVYVLSLSVMVIVPEIMHRLSYHMQKLFNIINCYNKDLWLCISLNLWNTKVEWSHFMWLKNKCIWLKWNYIRYTIFITHKMWQCSNKSQGISHA